MNPDAARPVNAGQLPQARNQRTDCRDARRRPQPWRTCGGIDNATAPDPHVRAEANRVSRGAQSRSSREQRTHAATADARSRQVAQSRFLRPYRQGVGPPRESMAHVRWRPNVSQVVPTRTSYVRRCPVFVSIVAPGSQRGTLGRWFRGHTLSPLGSPRSARVRRLCDLFNPVLQNPSRYSLTFNPQGVTASLVR